MLNKPICLHIPPLYEEGEATLSWESVDGSIGYTLECTFDKDFDAASVGRTWANIRTAGLSWREIRDLNLSWRDFANLPAQGLSWRNIQFLDQTWGEIQDKGLTWRESQSLPIRFEIYDGLGEAVPGPDQGLTWANIRSNGLTWRQIREKGLSWREFSLLPSVGLSWANIRSDGLTWRQIWENGLSWREFQNLPTRGLSWASLNAKHLTWSEIHAKGHTWRELQNLTDGRTHAAHTISVPLYKKKAWYRIKAYNETESSEYLTSSMIKLLPRSLKKYKPPCLHIPALHEGDPADIVWGDLYGASSYVLERKCSGDFEKRYDGQGRSVPRPADCTAWKELWYMPDCKGYFSYTDQIPYNEKKAVFRLKAHNTTDESQYLVSGVAPIIPIFERDDRIGWSTNVDKRYRLKIDSQGVRTFSGVIMNIKYDPGVLRLDNFAGQTLGQAALLGNVPGAYLRILSHANGQLIFECFRPIAKGREWDGAVTMMEFSALKAGTIQVQLT